MMNSKKLMSLVFLTVLAIGAQCFAKSAEVNGEFGGEYSVRLGNGCLAEGYVILSNPGARQTFELKGDGFPVCMWIQPCGEIDFDKRVPGTAFFSDEPAKGVMLETTTSEKGGKFFVVVATYTAGQTGKYTFKIQTVETQPPTAPDVPRANGEQERVTMEAEIAELDEEIHSVEREMDFASEQSRDAYRNNSMTYGGYYHGVALSCGQRIRELASKMRQLKLALASL